MNFLAHLYLSGNNTGIRIGNFIGDFVKGRNLHERFEADIAKGIELHRSIDEFTDSHPVVSKSKDRLRPGYRHYAPVIVDMFYDHILARNWNDYHPTLLPDYVEEIYKLMEANRDKLPEPVQYMLPYMMRGNWLLSYATIEGIHRALSGMAQRTSFKSGMDHAVHDLKEHYANFEREFREFFPELETFVAERLRH